MNVLGNLWDNQIEYDPDKSCLVHQESRNRVPWGPQRVGSANEGGSPKNQERFHQDPFSS